MKWWIQESNRKRQREVGLEWWIRELFRKQEREVQLIRKQQIIQVAERTVYLQCSTPSHEISFHRPSTGGSAWTFRKSGSLRLEERKTSSVENAFTTVVPWYMAPTVWYSCLSDNDRQNGLHRKTEIYHWQYQEPSVKVQNKNVGSTVPWTKCRRPPPLRHAKGLFSISWKS